VFRLFVVAPTFAFALTPHPNTAGAAAKPMTKKSIRAMEDPRCIWVGNGSGGRAVKGEQVEELTHDVPILTQPFPRANDGSVQEALFINDKGSFSGDWNFRGMAISLKDYRKRGATDPPTAWLEQWGESTGCKGPKHEHPQKVARPIQRDSRARG